MEQTIIINLLFGFTMLYLILSFGIIGCYSEINKLKKEIKESKK